MNNSNIVGLDVCHDRVVACFLSEFPSDVQEFYQNYDFLEFSLNRAGLNDLLSYKPKIAIYEPTGLAYSTVWVKRLEESGITCKAVDHAKLRAYRKGLGLPDKDDFADSLALACYQLYQSKQSRFSFCRQPNPIAQELRRISLRLNHLDRRKNPIINRLKQDLSIAFPEQANKSCDGAPLFWGWLAGERKSKRYDKQLAESIGLGILPETQLQAQALTQCLREETELVRQLESFVKGKPELYPYRKVLARFGFGLKIEAVLISYIYPFEDFLKEGKPETIYRKGKISGKRTARHLSLRRFQKVLGVAPTREDSGDTKKRRRSGSILCRRALWLYCYSRIETLKKKSSNSLILEFRKIWIESISRFQAAEDQVLALRLGLSEQAKIKGVKLKLARSYLRRKIVVRLFYELLKELGSE